MPRYAKKGSTKLDIMNKMFNEMKADPECKWVHIGNINDFSQIPNFASINPANYKDFIESYIDSEIAYTDRTPASKDVNKVDFDFENHEVDEADPSRAIHSKFPDGTEMIWFWAGGDWESSISFVLYLDPNDKIRAYIPNKGNCYCKKYNSAWGSCQCGAQEPSSFDVDYVLMYDDVINNIQTK